MSKRKGKLLLIHQEIKNILKSIPNNKNLTSYEKQEMLKIYQYLDKKCRLVIYGDNNELYTWNDCKPNDQLYSFLVKKGIF